MLGWMVVGTAFAGDLVITTTTPVVVKIDGTPIEFIPGTMAAQVSGISGIHRVEILSVTGQPKAQMNVSVPVNGGAGLVFDGMNLLMASAGDNGGAVVGKVGVPVAAPAPAPEPAKPSPMGADAFRALVAAVNDASFSADKVGAIKSAATGNWFTIAQVGALVDALDFSADRLAAVGACRSRVVDPENAFQLSSHFTFSSERDQALKLFR